MGEREKGEHSVSYALLLRGTCVVQTYMYRQKLTDVQTFTKILFSSINFKFINNSNVISGTA